MAGTNPFLNASRFSKITQNPHTLAIFLSIATHKIRNYDQLVEDTKMDIADVAPLVRNLENGGFIEKNPGPLSSKFKLAFNGQLFAEQLKSSYPRVKELLGEESLIEPIKVEKTLYNF